MARSYLQDREFRQLSTLPVHIEQIQVGKGFNPATNPDATDTTWETNDLCIIQYNSRTTTGFLPTTGSDRNSELGDFRIFPVKTSDTFYDGGNSRATWLSGLTYEANDYLGDQDYPPFIRKIEIRADRIFVFNVFYFDIR